MLRKLLLKERLPAPKHTFEELRHLFGERPEPLRIFLALQRLSNLDLHYRQTISEPAPLGHLDHRLVAPVDRVDDRLQRLPTNIGERCGLVDDDRGGVLGASVLGTNLQRLRIPVSVAGVEDRELYELRIEECFQLGIRAAPRCIEVLGNQPACPCGVPTDLADTASDHRLDEF